MSDLLDDMKRALRELGPPPSSTVVLSGTDADALPRAKEEFPAFSSLTVLLCDYIGSPLVLPPGRKEWDCGACEHCRARRKP